MRKNLRIKISSLVEKLGPEIFEEFDLNRIVKKKGRNESTASRDSFDNRSRASGSFLSAAPGAPEFSYYQQLELNSLFETLNVSYQDISNFMEGLENEMNF